MDHHHVPGDNPPLRPNTLSQTILAYLIILLAAWRRTIHGTALPIPQWQTDDDFHFASNRLLFLTVFASNYGV